MDKINQSDELSFKFPKIRLKSNNGKKILKSKGLKITIFAARIIIR